MIPQWIIEKKRDGHVLSNTELREFIDGFVTGSVPDYQMSAFAMAVYFNGMTQEETSVLTDAMMSSGDIIDTSSLSLPKADKHSTGGIGDKVSLILAPLVACHNIAVPMISGRGLGITGGTLDKLESIPGYRTDLSTSEFLQTINICGCSITGQTANLVPADKRLYALRDVTGTVPSIPLIAASIMSKKLAEGCDSLVLDVKCGTGAFMKTRDEAEKLAKLMVKIGNDMDRNMAAVITDMNQPLGRSAGNALEVIESILTLQGKGPEDLTELTIKLSAQMLLMSEVTKTEDEAITILRDSIKSGKAYDKFREMVHLHKGDIKTIDNPSLLTTAGIKKTLAAPESGWVKKADAEAIGRAVLALGAGRKKAEDNVDHAVGVSNLAKVGEKVEKGQSLATVHANSKNTMKEADQLLKRAFLISSDPVPCPALLPCADPHTAFVELNTGY